MSMLKLLQWVVAHPWLMRVLGALSGSLNPWNPDVRRNPYDAYGKLRAQPGLPRLRLFGGYVAARYADVDRLLHDPAFSTNRDAVPLMATFRQAASAWPGVEGLHAPAGGDVAPAC
jgi:cytochrome P450